MSHQLVYNYYINTKVRNSQLTEKLVVRVVDRALGRDVCSGVALEDEKEEDENEVGIDNDEKIIRFILNAVKSVNSKSIALCIYHQGSECNYIHDIIQQRFDAETCTWEFIVCLFAALDALIFECIYYATWYGYEESYIASGNVLTRGLIDEFTAIEDWILHNNGWMALLDNFDPSTNEQEVLKIICDMTSTVANV